MMISFIVLIMLFDENVCNTTKYRIDNLFPPFLWIIQIDILCTASANANTIKEIVAIPFGSKRKAASLPHV